MWCAHLWTHHSCQEKRTWWTKNWIYSGREQVLFPEGRGWESLLGEKQLKKTKPNKQYYQYPWFLANQLWIRVYRMRKAFVSDWWHFVLPTQRWNVLIRQSVLFCHEGGHRFSILEECSSSEKECFFGCKFQKRVRPG